jgi:uncharacterized membrane protein
MNLVDRLKKCRLWHAGTVFYILVIAAMAAMILFGTGVGGGAQSFVPARVVQVTEDRTAFNEVGARVGVQYVDVRLLRGEYRGTVVNARNTLFPIEHAVYAREGQRLLVFFQPGGTYHFAHVQSYDRQWGIYAVVIGFFGLLALVFGKTGLRSAFSLVFTFVTIIFLLIPLIVRGWSPAPLTIVLAFAIIVVSLISIMGYGRKTWVSIAGSGLGVLFTGIFYLLIAAVLRIGGFNVQEADLLIVAGLGVGAGQLLFCAILIASLGAVMDVAVSLASVTHELAPTKPKFKELFRSAMNVGRDIVASSSSTLILAFTGAFFIMLILFNVHATQYAVLINRTDIAIEVLRAISASAAVVVVAPATAFLSAWLSTSPLGAEKRRRSL